jgi:hypothetical protein
MKLPNRSCLPVLCIAIALTTTACKSRVPDTVVADQLIDAMKGQVPQTTSAMCGGKTKGLTKPEVSNLRVDPQKPSQGLASVKGPPWLTAGVTLPRECEGEVEFRFASTTSTSKKGNVRTNKTQWSLSHLKLISAGASNAAVTVEEDPAEAN